MAEDEDFSFGVNKSHVKPRHAVSSMEFSYASGNPTSYSSHETNFWREHPKLSQSSSIESYQNEVFDTESSDQFTRR